MMKNLTETEEKDLEELKTVLKKCAETSLIFTLKKLSDDNGEFREETLKTFVFPVKDFRCGLKLYFIDGFCTMHATGGDGFKEVRDAWLECARRSTEASLMGLENDYLFLADALTAEDGAAYRITGMQPVFLYAGDDGLFMAFHQQAVAYGAETIGEGEEEYEEESWEN